jgi:hypothetical protein
LVYYYLISGQQRGPVSFAELQASARRGGLLPDDLVWAPNLTDWSPAVSVPGLFPGSALSTEAGGQREGLPPEWAGSRVAPWVVSAILISLLALLVLVLLVDMGDSRPSTAAPGHESLQSQTNVTDV